MYESYWNLTANPFENTTDPSFFFPSEGHQGALLKLRYMVEGRKGAGLLSGGFGCGKTLLVSTLCEQLDASVSPIVHILFPQMGPTELLAYIGEELSPTHAQQGGGNGHGASLNRVVKRIESALTQNASRGKHALVVVDEAHLIDDTRTLEALRLLLNFEIDNRFGLSVVLVGQPPLLTTIERLNQFEERLSVKCILRPLTGEETVRYVSHRLTVAGGSPDIFDPSTLGLIYELSGGVPRKINRICDLAMLMAFANELETVEAPQVEAVAEELTVTAPE